MYEYIFWLTLLNLITASIYLYKNNWEGNNMFSGDNIQIVPIDYIYIIKS